MITNNFKMTGPAEENQLHRSKDRAITRLCKDPAIGSGLRDSSKTGGEDSPKR